MPIRLSEKVVPRASRNGIAGWLGDELKIRVSAPPEKGEANKAVEDVLAKVLGISAIQRGNWYYCSRSKTFICE